MSLATNRSIRPSSSRSAATTPRPRPSRSTIPASSVTSTNRPPSLRNRWSGTGGKPQRQAGDVRSGCLGVAAERWDARRPRPGSGRRTGRGRRRRPGRRRPPRSASRGRRPGRPVGHVLERPVAPVAIQRVRPPAGDEQVGAAVVVVVADGHPVAVAAAEPRDARRGRDVLERAVAAVAEQAVAFDRDRGWLGPGGNGPPWTT